MFNAKKFLSKFLILSFFTAIIVAGIFWNKTSEVKAEATVAVTGYAWSDIIGWINFNPANASCLYTLDCGVNYNNGTGQLSGYAWSDNIGWVYFGPNKGNISASTAPNNPQQWAKANIATGFVSGWAKTYRAIPDKTDINAEDGQTLGGWEGWIKMDHGMTNPVSIDFATGDFHGWAWSSDTAGIIGWISFNSKDCDLDNNGFIDIACDGTNTSTTPAYPYKVTIGNNNLTPSYVIEPAVASVAVGGTQRFTGYYDSDGTGPLIKEDKTLLASSWASDKLAVATIATTTSQAIASCLAGGTVTITSVYSGLPASASLECTTPPPPPPPPPPPVCGSGCSNNGYCGDGTINSGEQCDDGSKNGTNLSACSSSCKLSSCGSDCGNSTYEIIPKDQTVDKGKEQQFEGILTYANGFKETKTTSASWASKNTSVATINDTDKKGLALCVDEGSSTIESVYATKTAQTTLSCKTGGVGTITITSAPSTVNAKIIEGLPANSDTTTLTINSDACDSVMVSTPLYVDPGTPTFSPSKSVSLTGTGLKKTGAVNFSVKSIPGDTTAGTRQITVKAECVADPSLFGSTVVNLKIERVGSVWEEF